MNEFDKPDISKLDEEFFKSHLLFNFE